MPDRSIARKAWDHNGRPGSVGAGSLDRLRPGRSWAALTGLSLLVAAGLVPVSPAGAVSRDTPEPVDCSTTTAPTEAEARELALSCGTSVSVESLTDPWSQVTVDASGQARLSSSLVAERAPDPQDEDGDGTPWQALDASLVPEPADGRIGMVAPASDLTFSAGGGFGQRGPLASLTTADGHTVTLDVPFDLPEPRVDVVTRQVVYEDVFPRVDVVVTPNVDGSSYTEVIRAEDAAALEVPELEALTGEGLVFPVSVSDGAELVPLDGGGFDVLDATTGEAVAESGVPVAWDSAADAVLSPAPEEAASSESGMTTASSEKSSRMAIARSSEGSSDVTGEASGDAVVAPDGEVIEADAVDERRAAAPVAGDTAVAMESAVVQAADGGQGVSVRLDEATLDAMSGPVHVDPSSGEKKPSGTAVIQSAFPSTSHYNDSSNFPVGACTSAIGCPKTNVVRSAFQFTGMRTVAGLKKDDITKAVFTVRGYHSYSCTTRPVDLYRTARISSSTTWRNFGAGSNKWLSKLGTKTIAHKSTCNNVRDIEWNVKSAAQWMASKDSSMLTLGLKGQSSSDVRTWKRYSNPRLEVWWNRKPVAPRSSDMRIVSKGSTYGCQTSAGSRTVLRYKDDLTLRGVGRDPDKGDQVQVRFVVVDVATNDRVYESGWTGSRTQPFTFTRSVPASVLKSDRVYRWRHQTRDAGGRYRSYSSSPACHFEVDTTSPETPDVESAVYPEDEISGGAGQVGSFTFSAVNTPDVERFEYSFDSDTMDKKVSASSAGTAKVTPGREVFTAGSHYVRVQAVDNAGRPSKSAAVYRFSVRFPSVDAYWHLDEGVGTTAADSSGSGNDLTLGSGASWIEGPLSSVLQQGDPGTDWALDLDGTSGADAQADQRVLHMDEGLGEGEAFRGFAVSAFVRADSAESANQVAVSQDGQYISSFKLGRLATDRCPEGADGAPLESCWGFWMLDKDTKYGATAFRAVSDRQIAPGEWVHLTGVYDADRSELDLFVCPVGTPGEWPPPDDAGDPVLAQTTSYIGTTWAAGGHVQIGRGKYKGEPNDLWDGGIDDVRLYTNEVLDVERIRALCQGDLA